MINHLNRGLVAAGFTVLATPAFAHTGGAVSGFVSGFAHPFAGTDHLLAMVAVGIFAATRPARQALLAPLVFMAMLAGGALLGFSATEIAGVEPGILASGIVLGLMVAFGRQLPAAAGLVLLGGFALLHGHAHGTEAAGSLFAYLAGMLLASLALHGAGFAGGRIVSAFRHGLMVSGLALAAGGLALAAG